MFTAICKSDLKIEVVKEYLFHPTRKWRFDYAIPDHKIALEVEGGVWTGGRHTRPQGFLSDIEKYNAGTLLGWRIFPSENSFFCPKSDYNTIILANFVETNKFKG